MRSVLIILISFLFFNILFVLAVCFQIGNPTEQSQWLYEDYEHKEQYASRIKSRKVVIASGSNALFGIDSKMLKMQWNIPVVNDAVNAGLGLRYILYKSKKVLNKGDIAILPLEYFLYTMTDKPSIALVDYLLSRDPEYFYSLPVYDKLKIIFSISMKRILEGYQLFYTPKKNKSGIHGAHNLNVFGDQLNNNYESMSDQQLARLDTFKARKIMSTYLSVESINIIDNYINWANSRGVTLIFTPPTQMYFQYYESNIFQSFLHNVKNYFDDKNAPYIGNPYNYMYDKEFYFNTPYHLNSNGVKKRTKQLIKDVDETILNVIYNRGL